MKTAIQKRLKQIEKMYDVTILYACEAGSRAYQLETMTSDYDVRFIYKHKIDAYLQLSRPHDVINECDQDIQGWDLYKAMYLFTKSNPSLFEWLSSPIVYKEDLTFTEPLRTFIKHQYSHKAISFHYLQLLKTNLQKKLGQSVTIADIKRYVHIIRAYLSLQLIIHQKQLPPLIFNELLEQTYVNKTIHDYANMLVNAKRNGYSVSHKDLNELHTMMEDQSKILNEQIQHLAEGSINYSAINEFIITTLYKKN
ncbi:nucleotidyltransferase domain-containing protein [Bacillus sp. CGMCC 1.16541]|uniref:nucleotidyltransferase domain-containing protein n=1 Tax=Bacillus sp. CGMCC 1.16541 TaxID=2185143 RepID=UPI000D72FF08|nr:nucleotidyltransferase domain-containing protein [Bacillus sp. CGMCC 1.16541]